MPPTGCVKALLGGSTRYVVLEPAGLNCTWWALFTRVISVRVA